VRLENRVAIVTGGGSGIGRACALYLAGNGAKVIIADVRLNAAQETVGLIEAARGVAMAIETDVTKKADAQALAAQAKQAYGRIDILLNNAGIDIKGLVAELPEETWDKILGINLKGVFLCTQAVLPTMIEQKYGRVINISSMAGKTGEAYTSPYCASKWGVIGFTQSLCLEVGQHNITANCVCPGPVETELIGTSVAQAAALKGMTPADFFKSFFLDPTPLGRIAKPLDVAKAVVFLASDEAEFISGATLNVSGGREMH
jgi:NAD(P)-dependent dehydrogenase (short-subunit alcohol dehydrogenase family)